MIRVILVDDEILSRVGIQSLIDGKDDISVEGAFSSAEEALEWLSRSPVDIVITDIEMAEMDGLEFIRLIRERELADGIIILSCHDDFGYAQQAISNGTDSYMLKFSVTQESLTAEIHKVYEKTRKKDAPVRRAARSFESAEDLPQEGIYVIGILRPKVSGEALFDNIMLTNLLEDVVSRAGIGTYFAPYNRENFIIFRFGAGSDAAAIRRTLEEDFELIGRSVKGFVNVSFLWGISEAFEAQQEIQAHYDQAMAALEQAFYRPDQMVYYYKKGSGSDLQIVFSAEHYLEAEGEEIFQAELSRCLQKARFDLVPVAALKDSLVQALNVLLYQVMTAGGMSAEEIHKWTSGSGIVSEAAGAQDVLSLEETVRRVMHELRGRLIEELSADSFRKVLVYIRDHLKEQISLGDLADLCNMSVSSFSKKFKDRTGMTLVQYLNEQRIERAKVLLKNDELSLWQVAEETGFSSVNYLVRVFKKVTGQTIGEYRASL